MKQSPDERVRLRAQRLSAWLGFTSANTRAERHEATRQLRVAFNIKVLTSRPGDGRRGFLKTYVAGGKARVQRFVLDTTTEPSLHEGTEAPDSGPSAAPPLRVDGRWKSDGSGGCYWDAEDTGPDQCSPITGRWKLDGGECYFDSYDSGPDQCSPVAGRWVDDGGCVWDPNATGEDECEPPGEETCYSYGEEDDCPTLQDIEDAEAVMSAAEAELELMENQTNAQYAEYCLENPQECEDEQPRRSGPSADDGVGCAGQVAAALYGVALAGGTVWAARGLLAAPKIGLLGILGLGAASAFAIAFAALTVYNAYQCLKPALYPVLEPLPGELDRRIEH